MADKKFNKLIVLLIILVLVAIGVLVYYLFIKKGEIKEGATKETSTETSKEITGEFFDQEIAGGIYIKKPSNWGEAVIKEKVKGKYTKEKIEESGPTASCDFTRIKFRRFVQKEEDVQSYEDSIFVAKLSDMKRFYEVMKKTEVSDDFVEYEGEGGPYKIESIYEKGKVERSDLYYISKQKLENSKKVEEFDNPELYIFIGRKNAAPNFRDFGYIESQDGKFRGFWTIVTFHQDAGSFSDPYFIALMTDKENVIQFDFRLTSEKINDFRRRFEEESNKISGGNFEVFQNLDKEYGEFLKNIATQDQDAQKQVELYMFVAKSVFKK